METKAIEWVTQKKLCEALGISRWTVRRYTDAGLFKTRPRKTPSGGFVTLYNLNQARRAYTQPS